MLPQQRVTGLLHTPEVERLAHVPDGGCFHRVEHGGAHDAVAVRAREGGATSIEPSRRPLQFADSDRGAKHLVQRALQALQVGAFRCVQAHHLAPGMHAGVGTTGAGQLHGVAKGTLQGVGQRPRDCRHARL